MKPLIWLATSLQEVRRFPAEVKREIGYQLFKIQSGLEPADSKPMPSIGLGVKEVRIHSANQYRVIYTATYREAVYVIHAFVKKTRKTSLRDIELATRRFKQLMSMRKDAR